MIEDLVGSSLQLILQHFDLKKTKKKVKCQLKNIFTCI